MGPAYALGYGGQTISQTTEDGRLRTAAMGRQRAKSEAVSGRQQSGCTVKLEKGAELFRR